MAEVKTVGRENKGDIQISIKSNGSKSNNINLKSSVNLLYGEEIKKQIAQEMELHGAHGFDLDIVDDGALPAIISARVESAVRVMGLAVAPVMNKEKVTYTDDWMIRSRLYMPGNNPYLVQNAYLFGADCVILDLEDAVPPSEKEDTRVLVKHLLMKMNFGNSFTSVRINPLWTPYGEKDLREIVPACPDIIFIPKAESHDDIIHVEEIALGIKNHAHMNHQIKFFPIIESAKGVENAYEIATASEHVIAMAFGAEDYTKDIGVQRTAGGMETLWARYAVVNAAKAAGIIASDTVFSDLDDDESFISNTNEAKAMGFDGKGLIHPGQIDTLHKIYQPSEKEIEYAVKVIEAAKEAEKTGAGVVSLGRKMIDPPIVARAERTVKLAKKLGLID